MVNNGIRKYFKQNPTKDSVPEMSSSLMEKLDEVIFAFQNARPTGDTSLELDTGTGEMVSKLTLELQSIKKEVERLPDSFRKINAFLDSISRKEVKIPEFPKFPELKIPDTQKVTGEVKVINQINITEINKKLEEVNKSIKDIKFPDQKIEIPKINIPENTSPQETKQILKSLDELKKAILGIKFPEIQIPKAPGFPETIKVSNFPPQKYPMPVTNININPLRGSFLTNSVAVTTSPTPLPETPLDYRRSMIVFNADTSKVLYLGGENVSTSNGLPVAPESYSPPFDAGPRMTLYGATSSGSISVIVMEMSNEDIGG